MSWATYHASAAATAVWATGDASARTDSSRVSAASRSSCRGRAMIPSADGLEVRAAAIVAGERGGGDLRHHEAVGLLLHLRPHGRWFAVPFLELVAVRRPDEEHVRHGGIVASQPRATTVPARERVGADAAVRGEARPRRAGGQRAR